MDISMDDLPVLPFEKILSYLLLRDLIRSRAVSRRWCRTIDGFKVKSLFHARRSSGFIFGNSRLISGSFAQNFIATPKFESFFQKFGDSILSNLKHLRLSMEDNTAFTQTINSFNQLEELGLFGFNGEKESFELNLPMLNTFQLEKGQEIEKLTLNAPRLQKVRLACCSNALFLDLVHVESVEWLILDNDYLKVNHLKNLKYLHTRYDQEIDSTFLLSLKQLKEIHLYYEDPIWDLFEQKRRYDRTDLKIFLVGCLLNGPDDRTIPSIHDFNANAFRYLAENPARLADAIPLVWTLYYSTFKAVAPGLATNLLSRFPDLNRIIVNKSVQNVERFLHFLKGFNISDLEFWNDQPQELFDRLPEHSALQKLAIYNTALDLDFLFKLTHLLSFSTNRSINARFSHKKFIRKVFDELQFISILDFLHHHKSVRIQIDQRKRVNVYFGENEQNVADLNAAIGFIRRNT